MGYRIANGESLTSAFDRVAAEEFAQADAELRCSHDSQALHNARKSLKRLRALLQSMRVVLPKKLCGAANRRLRDAGRELSPLRDVYVQWRALHELKAGDSPAGQHVLRQLRHRQFFLLRQVPAQSKALRARLDASRQSLAASPRHEATLDDLAACLTRLYKQGRKAFKTARQSCADARLHEWRKKSKSLGYGLELVQDLASKKLGRMARRCDSLTESLGDNHDLVMVESALKVEHVGLARLRKRISRKRAKLRKRVFKLGPKLYREKPAQFQKRLRRDLRRAAGESQFLPETRRH